MFEENRVSGSVVGNQHLKPDTKNKVLLIDADTIAYAVCVVIEEGDEDVGFSIDLDYALTVAKEKIDLICDLTGVKDVELHFTGKDNFRYHIDDNYKSNRVGTRTPAGLFELKQLLINEYDKAYSHIGYEADDVVAMLKRTQPDKYILCAVDKDVLNGIAGVHFNYYKNDRFNISMKWVETTQKEAMKFPYIQCLTGDSSDGIKGVPNIGPKKAEKALKNIDTEYEMWKVVNQKYLDAGLTTSEAIVNMRLVNMNQLTEDYQLAFWVMPTEGDCDD